MSSLLRLECQQTRFLKILFEFAFFSSFVIHLKLKRQIRSYIPVISSKTIPDSRSKWAKSTPVFRPKRHKNLPFGAAHPYTAYIREYTPRGCVPSDNVIFQCFRYGVVIVTSDIRSSHHSDEEKSDFSSQQTVRVKRTLPKDAAEQHGPKTKNAVQQNKGEPAIDIKIYHPAVKIQAELQVY